MIELLRKIISNPLMHAKWLNTLSYMENCGARKIAGCEHPTKVKEEMLKHAAEEFRHAYYLKQQINKVWEAPMDNYAINSMLGGYRSMHYLHLLDIMTSRYLRFEHCLSGSNLKEVSYLLVTYAIEMRAGELYPLYHLILKETNSKVHVKSIVLEEEEHLADMIREISKLPYANTLKEKVCHFESEINAAWLEAIEKEVLIADFAQINHQA